MSSLKSERTSVRESEGEREKGRRYDTTSERVVNDRGTVTWRVGGVDISVSWRQIIFNGPDTTRRSRLVLSDSVSECYVYQLDSSNSRSSKVYLRSLVPFITSLRVSVSFTYWDLRCCYYKTVRDINQNSGSWSNRRSLSFSSLYKNMV